MAMCALLLVNHLSAKPSTPTDTIPFQLYGEKIFFKVVIYDTLEIDALFDNGIRPYIHKGTVQRHDIFFYSTVKMRDAEGKKEVNLIEKLGIRIGGFTDTLHQVVPKIAAPYLNRKVDLVLGYNWVNENVVEINYTAFEMYLYDPYDYVPKPTFDSIPVLRWGNYPMVQSHFTFNNGVEADLKMELNLGSEVGFNVDEHMTKKLDLHKNEPNKGRIMIVGPDGQGVEGMIIRIPAVSIGGFRQSSMKGGVFKGGFGIGNSEVIHGQIGQPYLKFYNIVLDKRGQVVYMQEKPEPE